MLKHTFSKSAVTKIQSFLEEVSSRGGHTIYFEDNKEDKKLLDTGFKLLGIKASWSKPQYVDRFTGKKNSRNGVISWSHLEHRVKYIDDDCTKGIDDITTTIHFRDGAWGSSWHKVHKLIYLEGHLSCIVLVQLATLCYIIFCCC